MSIPLSPDQIAAALTGLPGWAHTDQALVKGFAFAGFPEAAAFMVRVGFAAEAAGHHPRLVNVYNRVEVGLTTHDAGNRVTQKDVDLAAEVEAIHG